MTLIVLCNIKQSREKLREVRKKREMQVMVITGDSVTFVDSAFRTASVTSVSSSSASVSGVGVRCSNVAEEPVFGSDSSVSVGCSDSVSGVGARGLS